MTFDFTINIGTIVTLVIGFGAGVAAWVTALYRIGGHDTKMTELTGALGIAQASHGNLAERVETIRAKSAQELADFKLEVAKNYATNAAIMQVEERIVVAIDRLGDRFDKIIIDHRPPTRERRSA
jgi:hypothetical protein